MVVEVVCPKCPECGKATVLVNEFKAVKEGSSLKFRVFKCEADSLLVVEEEEVE